MSQFMKKSEVMDVRAAVEALQAAVIEGRRDVWEQQMKEMDQKGTSEKPSTTLGAQEAALAKQGAMSAAQEAPSAKQDVMSADQKTASAKQGVMSAAEEERSERHPSGQGQSKGGARVEEDSQGGSEGLEEKENGRDGEEAQPKIQNGLQQTGSKSDQNGREPGKGHEKKGAQESGMEETSLDGGGLGLPAAKIKTVKGSPNVVQRKAGEGGQDEEEKKKKNEEEFRWGDSEEEALWYEAGRKRATADYGNGEKVDQQEEAKNLRHAEKDKNEKGQAGESATEGAEAGANGRGGKGDTWEEQRGSKEGEERKGVDKQNQEGASENEDGSRTKSEGHAEGEGSAKEEKEEEENVEKEKELFGCGVAEIYRTDELDAGRSGRAGGKDGPDLSEEWLKTPLSGTATGKWGSQADSKEEEKSESGTWEKTAQALTHGWSGRPRLTVTEILEEPAEPGFAESERARKGKAKVDDGPGDDLTKGVHVSDDDVTRLAWHRTEQLINERWGAAGPEYFNPGMTPGGESAASQIAEMAEQAQVVQVSKLGEGLMTAVKTVLGGTRDAVLGWKERIEDAVGGSPRSPAAGDAQGLGVLGDDVDAALEKTSEGGVGAAGVLAGDNQERACDAMSESIAGDCASGAGIGAEGNGKGLLVGSPMSAGSGGGVTNERRSTTAGSKNGKETGYVALDEIDT